MLKLFSISAIYLCFLFLLSCGGSENQNSDVSEDSTNSANDKEVVEESQVQKVLLDVEKSKIDWSRTKTAENQKETIKIGKSDVQVDIGSITLTTNGELFFKSGELLVLEEEFQSAFFEIDMTTLKGININDSKKLEVGSPEYLHTEQFPSANLELDTFEKQDSVYQVSGTLTIKGKTNPITFPASITASSEGLPQKMNVTLSLDGLEWALAEPKTGKVTADKLTFTFEIFFLSE